MQEMQIEIPETEIHPLVLSTEKLNSVLKIYVSIRNVTNTMEQIPSSECHNHFGGQEIHCLVLYKGTNVQYRFDKRLLLLCELTINYS
jgi:hypothetical protein